MKSFTSFLNRNSGTKPPIRQKLFWVIIISVVVIAVLQYTSDRNSHLHELYRELYYFPIFISVLRFGTRGALMCLGVILAFYVPYIFLTWGTDWGEEAARLVELLLYLLFVLGAGYFVDRERQIKEELDRNRFITSLGRITSGIVHDLKNPLMSMTGLLERLAKGKGDSKTYLPVILGEVHRMERIVYDVLDFARPVKLKKDRCNLSSIVQSALETCREKAEKRGVMFRVSVDDSITLDADSFLLERALINIISNAVEASPSGSAIAVGLEQKGNLISITVQDHGPGMNKSTRDHCFEPYFSTKQGGTGLGLPIVKKIIEAHGGTIEIKSHSSGGTTFTITFKK